MIMSSSFEKVKVSSDSIFRESEVIAGRKQVTDVYRKWVHESGPYYWMITLTFKYDMPIAMMIKYTNKFLHNMNLKYFRSGYFKKENCCMNGFAFFEEHPMKTSNNDLHVHILVKPNERYFVFKPDEQEDIFLQSVAKVLTVNKKHVFSDDCVNITHSYSSDNYDYFFDELDDFSIHRMKIIDKNLLSDNISFGKEFYTKSYDRPCSYSDDKLSKLSNSEIGRNTLKETVLHDVYNIFKNQKKSKLRTRDIIDQLCEISDVYNKFNCGNNITGRQLAYLLKPFGISSCALYFRSGNAKGYKRESVKIAYKNHF